MKILVAASTFPRWTGDTVPAFVHALSAGLAAIGHEVHVLAPHAPGAATSEAMDGMRVHRFRYAPAAIESLCYGGGILDNLKSKRANWLAVPGFFASEYFALNRLARRERFDVVHAHWAVPQGIVTSLPRPFAHCPTVLSAHGSDILAARGPVFTGLVRRAVRTADACTANSALMQREILELTGVSATVIPMGVNLKSFSNGRVRAGQDSGCVQRLLFVGRLVEKKGLHVLIESLAEIATAVPGVTLTVVGDGPERAHLARRAKELRVDHRIQFAGAVSNSSLPPYYHDADLFIAPSLAEGLGVVLLEAAASKLPIVASNVGGIPDIVENGITGLLVPPGDSAELARAVIRMVRDRELRHSTARAAHAKVESRFSWDAVVARFDDLFHELAGDRRP